MPENKCKTAPFESNNCLCFRLAAVCGFKRSVSPPWEANQNWLIKSAVKRGQKMKLLERKGAGRNKDRNEALKERMWKNWEISLKQVTNEVSAKHDTAKVMLDFRHFPGKNSCCTHVFRGKIHFLLSSVPFFSLTKTRIDLEYHFFICISVKFISWWKYV